MRARRRQENQSGMERGAGPETASAPAADFAPAIAGGPGFGPIVVDPATGAAVWSQPARALFGLDPLSPGRRGAALRTGRSRGSPRRRAGARALRGDRRRPRRCVPRPSQRTAALAASARRVGRRRRVAAPLRRRARHRLADARRGGAAQPRGTPALDPRDRPRRDDRHRRGRNHPALQPRRRADVRHLARIRRSARTSAS